jgi:hypothetical protein
MRKEKKSMAIQLGEVRYEITMTVDVTDGKMLDWATERIEQIVTSQIKDRTFVENVTIHAFVDPTEQEQKRYEYNYKMCVSEDDQAIEEGLLPE